jgi:hypothetical protein
MNYIKYYIILIIWYAKNFFLPVNSFIGYYMHLHAYTIEAVKKLVASDVNDCLIEI